MSDWTLSVERNDAETLYGENVQEADVSIFIQSDAKDPF